MNILILSDEYLPESTRNHARMLHELAKHYILQGHNVIVLTPAINTIHSIEEEIYDHVIVWRFKTPSIRHSSNVIRAWREMLLCFNALKSLKIFQRQDFDLCINYSPTIFFSLAARHIKKNGGFVYLVLRDFFPQWIIDQKIISKYSLPAIIFKFFERMNYQNSHIIGVQSPANINAFNNMISYNCPPREVLYNWSDKSLISSDTNFGDNLVSRYRLNDKIILFYGGNIGSAQDMINILKLAKNIAHLNEAHILLVGQGNQFNLVKNIKEQERMENLTILPSVSQKDYSSLLQSVSIGLFSLAKNHSAHNFPGKLLGYMAASLPILGSVNVSNDIQELINNAGAGYITVNGDDDSFVNNAICLIKSKQKRKQMGQSSYALLNSVFSVENAANRIISHVTHRKA